ncbi:MAG: HAD hydrolase family protein, partial [Candidatus Omnitrophica bacterium]|nr:HAD hydrolase family protein [Candidatus Omnitrophota bacterium]
DIFPKSAALPKILSRFKVKEEDLCFVADDLVDLSLMKRVGFPVAVFNASPEIKQVASYITLRQGGRGAVREIAELILKAQGKWDKILQIYDV